MLDLHSALRVGGPFLYKLAEQAKECCSFGAAQVFTFLQKSSSMSEMSSNSQPNRIFLREDMFGVGSSITSVGIFGDDSISYQNIKIEHEKL